jgi:hypothetical protein
MNENIKIEFALECLSRHDEQAGVLVGYIPALRIYTQATDEGQLEKALISAAELFIVTCYERGILGQSLRDRGMTRAMGPHEMERAKAHDHQFISVSKRDESFEKSFTVKVPISLLAAQAVAA